GVRRVGRTCELALEAVPGARARGELLERAEVPPGGWRRLARALGTLLARLHALGLEHGDLHSGNVLVDARGAPWLVDVGHARTRRPAAARRAQELVLATALAREQLGARTRLAFLVGYRAALPDTLAPALTRADLVALEDASRVRRRALVEHGLNRWLRESSRVTRQGQDWRRRGLAPELTATHDPARFLAVQGEPAHLRALWLTAARLHEHHLPTVVPAWLAPERAVFELPARGARDEESYQALRLDRGLAADPSPAHDARGVYAAPTA
ncbi:MAG: lipopolysaccharide kinase InaA family protein, partial [Planctomycetota bacterium]